VQHTQVAWCEHVIGDVHRLMYENLTEVTDRPCCCRPGTPQAVSQANFYLIQAYIWSTPSASCEAQMFRKCAMIFKHQCCCQPDSEYIVFRKKSELLIWLLRIL